MNKVIIDLGLPSPPGLALVVEDLKSAQLKVAEALLSCGFEVIRVDGVQSVSNSSLIGLLDREPVPVPLERLVVAFLDFYFLGGVTDGGKLTGWLLEHSKCHVIGMSSSASANEQMFRNGARVTFPKRELLALIDRG
jgi:hypothetical protein